MYFLPLMIFFFAELDLSCGAQTSLVVSHGFSCLMAQGISVLRPGIEPTSPALESRFLTIELPRFS